MANADMDRQDKRLKTVLKTMFDHQMLSKGDAVLVGVSGGADSVALLSILKKLSPILGIRIGVGHLNHGIRGKAADEDAEFVKKKVNHLGLRCHVEKIDVPEYQKKHKLSLEHAARRVRYDFFYRISNRHHYNKIALGHQRDDNAEMILMALFRGTGPLGLAGIPPVRGQKIIRPLIRLTRKDIATYLADNGLDFITDESNLDTAHLRNNIRHRLLPLLRAEYNPSISESLTRMAEILRSEEEWIRQTVAPFFQSCVAELNENVLTISVSNLNQYHPALKRRITRMALEYIKGDLKEITLRHVDAIIELAGHVVERKRLDLPGRIRVVCDGRDLKLSKEQRSLRQIVTERLFETENDFCYRILGLGSVKIKETGFCLEFSEAGAGNISEFGSAGQQVAFFDIKKMNYPLVLRNYTADDRFKPFGMKGTKTVGKFLKDLKIPLDMRYRIPVLLTGEKIVWVVGFQIDDDFKVTAHTEKVLKITLRPCLSEMDD